MEVDEINDAIIRQQMPLEENLQQLLLSTYDQLVVNKETDTHIFIDGFFFEKDASTLTSAEKRRFSHLKAIDGSIITQLGEGETKNLLKLTVWSSRVTSQATKLFKERLCFAGVLTAFLQIPQVSPPLWIKGMKPTFRPEGNKQSSSTFFIYMSSEEEADFLASKAFDMNYAAILFQRPLEPEPLKLDDKNFEHAPLCFKYKRAGEEITHEMIVSRVPTRVNAGPKSGSSTTFRYIPRKTEGL